MALNPPTGSGGTGNKLGPEQNAFNTILDRDNYATANASWLAEYDANTRLMVKVGFTGDYYTRENTAWALVVSEGEPVSVDPSVTTEVIVKYDPLTKQLVEAVKGDTLDGEAIATVPEVTTALGFFMEKSDYDTQLKQTDVYDMDNMEETATAKIMTDAERTKLTGVEALAEVNNISDVNATDLTDGDETALHTHAAPINPRIDADLSTNLTLDTGLEEKIIPFDVNKRSSGITLSVGEFTMPIDGRYRGDLALQIDETSDPTFMVWVEVKPLALGSWILGGGLRKTKVKDDGFYTITLAGTMELSAGDKIRISTAITNSADTAIIKEVSQALNLGTAVQPSATLSIDWLGPLTP